ncbi:MAG: hypothetical protein IJY23_06060 [Clostridia bacterium]|nr:hypothetical protein [Clostridia bacterium]
MFGVDNADVTKEEFLAMVDANLTSYADSYIEEFNQCIIIETKNALPSKAEHSFYVVKIKSVVGKIVK